MDADPKKWGKAHPKTEPDFRRIVDDHAEFVWRALHHLGVRDRDVEDACQDVFLVVHKRLADFRGESALRTWIYGIATRVASEHRRRAHVRRELPTAELPTTIQAPEQDERVGRRELRNLLELVLDQIDDDKCAVFVLYEIEELGMKEVAQALGCPLQTAYSRLHAARKLVAEAVSRLEPGGTDGQG